MSRLSLQCGTIQITSVTGESRYANVSGLAKLRVLWLLRNFSILDFPVLSKGEQQLITRLWQAGTSRESPAVPLDVVGSIEGFPKRLCQPQLCGAQLCPTQTRQFPQLQDLYPQLRTTQSREASVPALKPNPQPVHYAFPSNLRTRALWAAAGVSLLGWAIYLGQAHWSIPRPHLPVAAAHSVRLGDAPPVRAAAFETNSVAARKSNIAPEGSRSVPLHLPDAMAAPSPDLTAQKDRVETRPRKPQVIIRVSVDSKGRAASWKVLQGNKVDASAALAVAMRWRFQPCSSSVSCEHLLKFTDHGDVSVLQMLD